MKTLHQLESKFSFSKIMLLLYFAFQYNCPFDCVVLGVSSLPHILTITFCYFRKKITIARNHCIFKGESETNGKGTVCYNNCCCNN